MIIFSQIVFFGSRMEMSGNVRKGLFATIIFLCLENCCDGVTTILIWWMDRWARWQNSVNNSILKFRTLREIVATTFSSSARIFYALVRSYRGPALEQHLSVYVSWRWLWKFALRAYDKPVWVCEDIPRPVLCTGLLISECDRRLAPYFSQDTS